MYETNKQYRNRHGIPYEFKTLNGNILFKIEDFGFGRFGGLEGEQGINWDNLGMFDPSGGPYIALGCEIYDVNLGYVKVTRIRSVEENELILEFE